MVDGENEGVLNIIIINAIGSNGKPQGCSQSQPHTERMHTITISSDNGSGIAQENINKLFSILYF